MEQIVQSTTIIYCMCVDFKLSNSSSELHRKLYHHLPQGTGTMDCKTHTHKK